MGQTALAPNIAFTHAAAEQYDPQKGWNTVAHPEATAKSCKNLSDYADLAQRLVPNFQRKIDAFLAQNHLRAIHVSQQVWHDQFEMGTQNFREWLKDHCERTGQSLQADVLVVDACAKSEKRWGEKLVSDAALSYAKDPGSPVYTKDGVRGMILKLAEHNKKRDLDNFGSLIDSLENSPETLAYNNQYRVPHASGYRGYHAVWGTGDLTTPSRFGRVSMIGEMKLEHEDQLPLNILTRRFQVIIRAGKSATAETKSYQACGWREGSIVAVKSHKRAGVLFETGRMAYDYMHAQKGFDHFLGEDAKLKRHVPTAHELNEQIRKITHGDLAIRNLIAQTAARGFELRGIKTPSYVPILATYA